jgi:hypothetical protein
MDLIKIYHQLRAHTDVADITSSMFTPIVCHFPIIWRNEVNVVTFFEHVCSADCQACHNSVLFLLTRYTLSIM